MACTMAFAARAMARPRPPKPLLRRGGGPLPSGRVLSGPLMVTGDALA